MHDILPEQTRRLGSPRALGGRALGLPRGALSATFGLIAALALLLGVAGCGLFFPRRLPPGPQPLPLQVEATEDALVAQWLGHSTVLLRLGGVQVLTDPFLRDSLVGMRRQSPVGLRPGELPQPDVVLLSHLHFDHCDISSLSRVARPGATLILPAGGAAKLPPLPHYRVVELAPWQELALGELRVRAFPVDHFGGRHGSDSWGDYTYTGFVLQAAGRTVLFAGDTAYTSDWAQQVGARYPDADLALIPIGPYRGEGRSSRVHVGPLDALRILVDLRARRMIPIHFESFWGASTGDPPDAPRRRLKQLAAQRRLGDEVWDLYAGERLVIGDGLVRLESTDPERRRQAAAGAASRRAAQDGESAAAATGAASGGPAEGQSRGAQTAAPPGSIGSVSSGLAGTSCGALEGRASDAAASRSASAGPVRRAQSSAAPDRAESAPAGPVLLASDAAAGRSAGSASVGSRGSTSSGFAGPASGSPELRGAVAAADTSAGSASAGRRWSFWPLLTGQVLARGLPNVVLRLGNGSNAAFGAAWELEPLTLTLRTLDRRPRLHLFGAPLATRAAGSLGLHVAAGLGAAPAADRWWWAAAELRAVAGWEDLSFTAGAGHYALEGGPFLVLGLGTFDGLFGLTARIPTERELPLQLLFELVWH